MRVAWYVPLAVLACLCLALAASAESTDRVTLTGKVLLPDGSPAAGARVETSTGSTVASDWVETQSRADGSWQLTVPSGGMPSLRSVVAIKAGYAPSWATADANAIVTLRLGAQPATYQGRVCDPEGHPLVGATAEVVLLTLVTAYSPGPPCPVGPGVMRATSDAQGRFSLPDLPAGSDTTLLVSAPGRARTTRIVHVGGATAPVILPVEAIVSGRVLRQGQPVAGVKVRTQGGWLASAEAVTDAQGAYRLDGLGSAAGLLRLETPPVGWVAAPLLLPDRQPGDTLKGLDFNLTPGALLRGKVTDAATGQPLGGAYLSVLWSGAGTQPRTSYAATVGADGTYELRAPAGHVRIILFGLAPLNWMPTASTRKEFDVKEGETRDGVDFAVKPLPLLQGHLVRPDGTPAPGLEVKLVDILHNYALRGVGSAPTDAEGAWQLSFPTEGLLGADEPQLVLAPEPATGLVAGAWVNKPQGDLRLTLAPGAYVVCRALDPQGRPVPDVMVGATLSTAGDAQPAGNDNGGEAMLPAVPTDAQGQARLGPLPAGYPVSLDLRSDRNYEVGHAWGDEDEFTLAAREEHVAPILIIDRAGRTLAGTVMDTRGQPAGGALVYAAGAPEAVETDQTGHFSIPHVPLTSPAGEFGGGKAKPPGTIAVLLAADPVLPFLGVATIQVGHEGAALVRLAPLGSATGQVVDEAGQPLRGVYVLPWSWFVQAMPQEVQMRLQELGGPNSHVTTDAEGRWKLAGLLAGLKYQIHFYLPGKNWENTERDVTGVAGETVQVEKVVLKPAAARGEDTPTPVPPPPAPGAAGPAPAG